VSRGRSRPANPLNSLICSDRPEGDGPSGHHPSGNEPSPPSSSVSSKSSWAMGFRRTCLPLSDIQSYGRHPNMDRLTQCPQYGQTLVSWPSPRPQEVQVLAGSSWAGVLASASSLPQSLQNFFPSGFSEPQFLHFMTVSALRITSGCLKGFSSPRTAGPRRASRRTAGRARGPRRLHASLSGCARLRSTDDTHPRILSSASPDAPSPAQPARLSSADP